MNTGLTVVPADGDGRQQLLASALTLRAYEKVAAALGPLAAQPLSEPALEKMRKALDFAGIDAVRQALREHFSCDQHERPELSVISSQDAA